jgi:hypothetical protein
MQGELETRNNEIAKLQAEKIDKSEEPLKQRSSPKFVTPPTHTPPTHLPEEQWSKDQMEQIANAFLNRCDPINLLEDGEFTKDESVLSIIFAIDPNEQILQQGKTFTNEDLEILITLFFDGSDESTQCYSKLSNTQQNHIKKTLSLKNALEKTPTYAWFNLSKDQWNYFFEIHTERTINTLISRQESGKTVEYKPKPYPGSDSKSEEVEEKQPVETSQVSAKSLSNAKSILKKAPVNEKAKPVTSMETRFNEFLEKKNKYLEDKLPKDMRDKLTEIRQAVDPDDSSDEENDAEWT